MKKLTISISHDNPDFEKRIRYVFQFLEHHSLVEGKWGFVYQSDLIQSDRLTRSQAITSDLFYGDTPPDNSNPLAQNAFFIPAQQLIFSREQADSKTLFANFFRFNDQTIYSVERLPKKSQEFVKTNCLQFDIIETLFFHISRYEEVFAAKEDLNQAGWLEEEKQFLIHHELQEIPVVDHLVKAFFEVLSSQKIREETTYDISHDLDILYRLKPVKKIWRALAGNIFYQRGLRDFMDIIHHVWHMRTKGMKDPYDNFKQLLREEKTWIGKQLFLMVGGNTKYDNKYSINHPYIDRILQMAYNKGYKIGLHPSYNAGFKSKIYKEELHQLAIKLGHVTKLNRQHCLRFSWKTTPYLWEENGIEIDYSMGFNQHLGFRCGTGFAYYMYDFINERAFSWKEQPMAFMESAAIHHAANTGEDLKTVMREFLLKNKWNTHININFHNSNFDPLLETGKIISQFYYEELIKIIES